MKNCILAIDQGTTGTTCLLIKAQTSDAGGLQVVGRGYAELPQHFPTPGQVEHDLDEIWKSTRAATERALKAAALNADDIAAIGITNQRETTGVWRRDGRPLHRAIVWQDRRTQDRCKELVAAGHEDLIRQRTGLVVDPYFSGTKIAWLLDHIPDARRAARDGDLCFGTMDTWLVWKLTGGRVHATDITNASRTMLFDLHAAVFSDDLARIVGDIPKAMLPEIKGCDAVFGHTRGLSFLPDGIPISGIAGDQHAALFGQACFEPGMVKCTYGTGAFALVNIGPEPLPSQNGLLTTVAWKLGEQTTYAIEGSTFVAGAIVQWLRDGLGFFAKSSDVEALAAEVESSEGVVVVPALTGLGAPHWRPEARGTISGLTRGSTRAHIARAALEGIAFQIADLLGAMREDSGRTLSVLRVDGGASANDLLMQFQADLLGIPIHRPAILETTALGAGALAALGAGIYEDAHHIAEAWRLEKTYHPSMPAPLVEEKLALWRRAVAVA